MSARRVAAALLAMLMGAALISVLPGAPRASADGAPSGSAATVSGTGEFTNLKVTVSQTKNLISQTVRVSWTGGLSTPASQVHQNFLQIMQCWGDDPAGPDRTQCQFGASGRSDIGGLGRRVLQLPNPDAQSGLMDPAEKTFKPVNDAGAQSSNLPFWPVGGTRPTEATLEDANPFFDSQITNEVPIARTSPDGTGEANFEIETVLQAAGLGCGDPVDMNGTMSPRSCWLVIVPRGTTEVDGSPGGVTGLNSSPLSQTNWNNKIAVHLEFLPQGRTCPLGAPERSLKGHEFAVEAVSRWQPALCANGGSLYSFTQLNDDGARSQLLQATDPGLTLISKPVPPDQQRADRPLIYAPVALSGLAFAFRIVKNPVQLPDSDPKRLQTGGPFAEMNLTPRLVAKLLTQSYQGAIVHKDPGAAAEPNAPSPLPPANPWGLTNDPEFLDLNPGYRDFLKPNLPLDVLVQLGTSDLAGQLWDWVLADPDARAFIDGTPDPSGMVVNQANKGLRPPLYTYPRNDLGCIRVGVSDDFKTGKTTAQFCNEDAHQFANDMHQAARAAGRGDPLGGNGLSGATGADGSVSYPKAGRQAVTDQALIAVVDVATADRYGLQTAKLLNAAGQFVAPDDAGLRAGAAAMKAGAVLGVLQPDPVTKNAAAYPLTSLSYAVTSPPALTQEAGRDYAKFLRYAVGAGQQPGDLPGQLPLGFVPLPDPLRQQALAAATIIETQAGKSTQTPAPPPAANNPGGTSPGLAGPAAPNTSPPGGTSPNTAPVPAPGAPGAIQPGAAPSPGAASPTTPGTATAVARRTPALPAPAVGALLLTILISGALAAASSPVLQSPVIHRLTAAVRRLMRREVTPTE